MCNARPPPEPGTAVVAVVAAANKRLLEPKAAVAHSIVAPDDLLLGSSRATGQICCAEG